MDFKEFPLYNMHFVYISVQPINAYYKYIKVITIAPKDFALVRAHVHNVVAVDIVVSVEITNINLMRNFLGREAVDLSSQFMFFCS